MHLSMFHCIHVPDTLDGFQVSVSLLLRKNKENYLLLLETGEV